MDDIHVSIAPPPSSGRELKKVYHGDYFSFTYFDLTQVTCKNFIDGLGEKVGFLEVLKINNPPPSSNGCILHFKCWSDKAVRVVYFEFISLKDALDAYVEEEWSEWVRGKKALPPNVVMCDCGGDPPWFYNITSGSILLT